MFIHYLWYMKGGINVNFFPHFFKNNILLDIYRILQILYGLNFREYYGLFEMNDYSFMNMSTSEPGYPLSGEAVEHMNILAHPEKRFYNSDTSQSAKRIAPSVKNMLSCRLPSACC